MTFVLDDALSVILSITLIILVITLIVLVIKLIKTLKKVDNVIDDVDTKMHKVDGVFDLIDTTADFANSISDKVINGVSSFINLIFKKKSAIKFDDELPKRNSNPEELTMDLTKELDNLLMKKQSVLNNLETREERNKDIEKKDDLLDLMDDNMYDEGDE